MRKKLHRKRDKRVFSKLADRTRAINLYPLNMRGGIRL